MKTIWKFDNEGIYIEPIRVGVDSKLFENTTDIEPPNYYRAKWTGTKWIEDMTQEEIDALNSRPKPKTQLEILQETVDMLVLDNLGVL